IFLPPGSRTTGLPPSGPVLTLSPVLAPSPWARTRSAPPRVRAARPRQTHSARSIWPLLTGDAEGGAEALASALPFPWRSLYLTPRSSHVQNPRFTALARPAQTAGAWGRSNRTYRTYKTCKSCKSWLQLRVPTGCGRLAVGAQNTYTNTEAGGE